MKISPAKNNGVPCFVVNYKQGEKYRRKFFPTKNEARAFAMRFEGFADNVADEWVEIPPRVRAELVMLYEDAAKIGLTPRQLWNEFTTGKRLLIAPKECPTLQQAVLALIEAKKKANRRESYLTELFRLLKQFMHGREETSLAHISSADLERWLDLRSGTPATRSSLIGKLSALFQFGFKRGWIQENPCHRLEKPSIEYKAPQILSVADSKKLLTWVELNARGFLPWVVLGLMAGFRPEEADHIGWEIIDLDRGVIRIDAAMTKVRERRLVHLEPAAVAWLNRCQGLPLPLAEMTRKRAQRKARDAMGWKSWPQDVLRHTAASMLLALHQDAGKVAYELGNSPAMLFKHYRELVTKEEAAEFWAITSCLPGPQSPSPSRG